jgi:predicted  nucleic acid-binding Zn-ribbon protein
MKDFIKKELNRLVENEPQVYGQEGIARKVAELTRMKERLVSERNKLNKEIKDLEKEIVKWEKEISPNQISLF